MMVPDAVLTFCFVVVVSGHAWCAPGVNPNLISPGGIPFRFTPNAVVPRSAHSRVRRSPMEFSHPLHIGSSISYFRSPAEISPTPVSPYRSLAYNRPRNRIQTRRTLPFQLVPQPPLGYAHSRNYVDLGGSQVRSTAQDTRAKAADILSMLNSLTEDLRNQKHRLRFGFF
eukprot:maker-scaffold229_size244821-snap-gene-1.18 protein:Tk01407 transcript:maker-scaffold229_size244821-snap-gene-1.18-mRNA-1 annotation:"aminoglycoside n(3 )-acetyltransferase"